MQHIHDAVKVGLWPQSKTLTNQKGLPELEELGYNLFYISKNADLYFVSGEVPQVLLIRSDRTSVFDIPLDLEIEGKGVVQTQISNLGFDFAESMGIKTARRKLPENLPESIIGRAQFFELCKPLETDFKGKKTGMELIFRNYLTGSLYKSYKQGLDPYKLYLPQGMNEWDKFESVVFTPTTKGVKDEPMISTKVTDDFSNIVCPLYKLFDNFTQKCLNIGIVVVDTKFEVFKDHEGDWVLGDEVLTPECSRFITHENFAKGNYKSMDKQILRDFGEKAGWKISALHLEIGEKLYVKVPQDIQKQILLGYIEVYKALKRI